MCQFYSRPPDKFRERLFPKAFGIALVTTTYSIDMEIEQFLQKIGTFGLVLRAEKEKLILETQEHEVSDEKLAFVQGNQEIINYIRP